MPKTRKMYGGDINDKWIQYGDLCVRRNNESNLGGNWYVVTNRYTDNEKTINTSTRVTNKSRDDLIRNDTLFAKHINEIRLGDPQVIQWCEENGNDFGIINADEVNLKMNGTVERYLTIILKRVKALGNVIDSKGNIVLNKFGVVELVKNPPRMSNYIQQIKNIVNIDSYLPQRVVIPTTVDIGPESAGIHFGDLIIQNMSGPVSTYYLCPTKSIYDSKTTQFFPLLLLFGDAHRSYENSCSPCDYTNMCYKISDPYLLKKIDALSTPTHPIDFYTETLLEDTGEGFKNGYMEELTTQNMIVCSNHQLKTTNPTEYAKKCPTQNIRWQGGDPRHSMNYSESFFVALDKNFKQLIVTRQLAPTLELLKQYHFETIAEVKQFFNPIMEIALTGPGMHDALYTQFTNNVFLFLSKGNSLILKQINKQTHPEFKRIEFWKNLFKMSLQFEFEKYKVDDMASYALTDMFNLLDNLEQTPDLHLINALLLFIMSPFMNIYAIARILKQPEKGVRSTMSICYFGNDHIENMVFLLKHIGYELVFENPVNKIQDKMNRCQKYTTMFNLTAEWYKHKLAIDKERPVINPDPQVTVKKPWYKWGGKTRKNKRK
jgi:hypothetical protein